jgi:hypothetical protein
MCAENAFVLPEIQSGAWLGFFTHVTTRLVSSVYGHITYVQG